MKKQCILSGIIALTHITGVNGMQSPRPAIYEIMDPLANTLPGDWPSIFTMLDKMEGTIEVNAYRQSMGIHRTLLELAVRDRNLLAAKELLKKYNADPNLINPYIGGTALTEAVLRKDAPMVQLLLEYGGNPYLKDHNGFDSFESARRAGATTILELLEQSIQK